MYSLYIPKMYNTPLTASFLGQSGLAVLDFNEAQDDGVAVTSARLYGKRDYLLTTPCQHLVAQSRCVKSLKVVIALNSFCGK